jgi:hypothetical protein
MTHDNVIVTTKDWEQALESQKMSVCTPSLESSDTCTAFTDTERELRITHRSLREKARGEMSEFERQYPW